MDRYSKLQQMALGQIWTLQFHMTATEMTDLFHIDILANYLESSCARHLTSLREEGFPSQNEASWVIIGVFETSDEASEMAAHLRGVIDSKFGEDRENYLKELRKKIVH